MGRDQDAPDLAAGSPPWTSALVVGAGASGSAAARLLQHLGVRVRVYDRRPEVAGLPAGVETSLGHAQVRDADFAGIDLLVLSPGVDPRPIRARGSQLAPAATVHGELSLAAACIASAWPRLPTVLITGTNGKSTVTAMVGELLAAGGLAPFTGGNLGPTLCDLVREVSQGQRDRPGALVLECSSYQLETTLRFPVDVAMVLNVTPDHLDRYPSMEEYALTKARVFAGLGAGGLALLAAADPFTARLRAAVPREATLACVDGDEAPRVDDERLWLSSTSFIERVVLGVAGRHNAVNALFAALAARHLAVPHARCVDALAAFVGLPHRMTPVGEIDGIAYYDDSKATNVASVLASMSGFARPFVLIAGGRAKGDDLRPLGRLLGERARGLVTLGEASELFQAIAPAGLATARAGDMAEAVRLARGLARSGDAVVLSPACASWDMYDSYAHRGRAFAAAVAAIKSDAR